MKKALFVVFLCILAISAFNVSGADLVAIVVQGDRTVEAGGNASFIVNIKNNQVREDTLKLDINDFDVAPFSKVLERVTFDPKRISVGANKEERVKVTLKFLEEVSANKNYVTQVNIESTIDPTVKTTVGLPAFVIPSKGIIDINLDVPDKILPGKEEVLTVNFENKVNINFEDLDVLFTSSVFNYEDKISLAPFEKKEESLNFNLDPLTPAGEHTLNIRVFDNGKVKGSDSFKFSVGLNPDLKEVNEAKKGFLISTIEIVRKNEGNTVATKTVKYSVGWFSRLFTTVNPETEIITVNGEKVYEWVFDINPGETYRIEITTNYRKLFFIIVGVLIVIGLFLYLKNRGVKISKSVFQVSRDKDKPEFKILLSIKNNTKRELYNVRVIDFLPNYTGLSKDFGTLRPEKIEEGSRGLRVVWKFDKFDSNDERIISYKLKMGMGLTSGKLSLPEAMVQFYGRKKNIVHVRSNKLEYKL